MKRILSIVAIAAPIAFVAMIIVAMIAYPMHIGEPSWYHVARIDCLMAATACGLVAVVSAVSAIASAIASVHF